MSTYAKRIGAVLGVVLGGAVMAADLPKLPAELQLPKSEESPGVVAFRHESHVDSDKPSCTGCHPKHFGILGRSSAAKRPAITHAAMEKGEACGACHGKQAFNFDDCNNCHAQ